MDGNGIPIIKSHIDEKVIICIQLYSNAICMKGSMAMTRSIFDVHNYFLQDTCC